MVRKWILLALALVAVALLPSVSGSQSVWPADRVEFDDDENLQEKLDAGDLGAGATHGDGANCLPGEYPDGVDENGAVQICTPAATEIDSSIATHKALPNDHHVPPTVFVPDADITSDYADPSTGFDASVTASPHGTTTNAHHEPFPFDEFDAVVDISDRTTACENWATAVEPYMNGTIGTEGDYHVAVVGTPDGQMSETHFYDESGVWPYFSCFMLHPESSDSPTGVWPDSNGPTAVTDLATRSRDRGAMTLHMMTGEIPINEVGMTKNACLFDFGNGYIAGRNGNDPYGRLNGSIKVVGDTRVTVQNESTSGYADGGTVGEGIPEGTSTTRFSTGTSTFVPFCMHGSTYVDMSKWTVDWYIDDDDIGLHMSEAWGSSGPIVDAVNGGEGVGIQFFGPINNTMELKNLRDQDYGIVWGGGDATDDSVHYWTSCASGNCTATTGRGVRGVKIIGGVVEGHSQALGVMIDPATRFHLNRTHWECGTDGPTPNCAVGGFLFRPQLCDGTGTTPVAKGRPAWDAPATECAVSGGAADIPVEQTLDMVLSLQGMPLPSQLADDVPNIWIGPGSTDRYSISILDGTLMGRMTVGSAGDDSYAPFKVSSSVDCDGVDGCTQIYLGATSYTPQDHDDAPANVPHVDYAGLLRINPRGTDLSNGRLEIPATAPGDSVPVSCDGSEVFIHSEGPAGEQFYVCESGSFVLQHGTSGADILYGGVGGICDAANPNDCDGDGVYTDEEICTRADSGCMYYSDTTGWWAAVSTNTTDDTDWSAMNEQILHTYSYETDTGHNTTWGSARCLQPRKQHAMDSWDGCGAANGNINLMFSRDVLITQISFISDKLSETVNGCDFRLTDDDGSTAIANTTLSVPDSDVAIAVGDIFSVFPATKITAGTSFGIQIQTGSFCEDGTGCSCGTSLGIIGAFEIRGIEL